MSVRLFILLLVSLVSSPVSTHPGTLAKDGCHRCKKNCAPHGKDGERHCHKDQKLVPVKNPQMKAVKVVKVVDGDTIKVETLGQTPQKFTVRILGIDCPESRRNKKCKESGACDTQIVAGKRATEELKKLIDQKSVILTTWKKAFERDRHERTLAYVLVLVDGEEGLMDVGRHLVKGGFCKDYGYRYPHPRSEEYLK